MMTGLRIGRLTAIGSMVLICTAATSVVRAPAVAWNDGGRNLFVYGRF
jgi:hypothetical protein